MPEVVWLYFHSTHRKRDRDTERKTETKTKRQRDQEVKQSLFPRVVLPPARLHQRFGTSVPVNEI